MHPLIRKSMTSIPGLAALYYWARGNYHELRTARAARRYFLNYAEYREALRREAPGTVDIRTADGLSMRIRRNIWDARILQEMFLSRPYLQHVRIPADAIVVDIGGYIGDFSVYAVKHLHARRVIVYEPSPRNFELLSHNIVANGYVDRITPVNMAVSDSSELSMDVDAPDRGQVNVSAYGPVHGPRRTVPSTTLAEIMTTHRLERVDLVKIDCEGAEYAILLSTPWDVLSKIDNIVFEYHEINEYHRLLHAVRERLGIAGYRLTPHAGSMISAGR